VNLVGGALRIYIGISLSVLLLACGSHSNEGSFDPTALLDGGSSSKPRFSVVLSESSVGVSSARASGLALDANIGQPVVSEFKNASLKVQPGIMPQAVSPSP
jgi:hypothetical protein